MKVVLLEFVLNLSYENLKLALLRWLALVSWKE